VTLVTGSALKIGFLAAAGALIVGGLAIGTVLAQQTPATTAQQSQREGRGRFMEVVAAKLGVPLERLQQAVQEARQELGTKQGPRERPAERRGEARERVRGMMQRGVENVARELNISVEQLRGELRGSSVAAVARAHGVAPEQVATALTNAAAARIDAAADEGRITPERATRMKQRVGEAIQRMMERRLPAGRPRERAAV
jgi:ribosomal protein S20